MANSGGSRLGWGEAGEEGALRGYGSGTHRAAHWRDGVAQGATQRLCAGERNRQRGEEAGKGDSVFLAVGSDEW